MRHLELYPAVPRPLECRIKDAFDVCDADGDGVVSRAELETVNVRVTCKYSIYSVALKALNNLEGTYVQAAVVDGVCSFGESLSPTVNGHCLLVCR